MTVLLKKDPHVINNSENTPLHVAAIELDVPRVAALLQQGADPNARNKHDNTPLTQMMVCTTRMYKPTILQDTLNIITLLLRHGADVNIQAPVRQQQTPLHIAVECGWPKIAALLILHGANINAQDNHGKTPLMSAMNNNFSINIQKKMIEYLLEKGADPTLSSQETTPLHLWVARIQHVNNEDNARATLQTLLKKGANVHAVDFMGQSPLLYLCHHNDVVTARIFLEHGADPNLADKKRNTALHNAVGYPDDDVFSMIRQLLNYGADIHARNNDGDIPLSLAIKRANVKAIQVLMQQHPQVHLCQVQGKSLVEIATHPHIKEIVQQEIVKREQQYLQATNVDTIDHAASKRYRL